MKKKFKRNYAFVDDSGDPGFAISRGSSKNFVVSMIVFSDWLEVEKTSVSIKEWKRKIIFPDEVEIKFNKSSNKTRISFLKQINNFDFSVYAINVDKESVHSDELRTNKDSFYKYFIKELLKSTLKDFGNVKVIIDGSGSKNFKKSFISYLRRESKNDKQSIDISFGDSKNNMLIQLADMIAGSIRISMDNSRTDKNQYRDVIKTKIKNIWDFK